MKLCKNIYLPYPTSLEERIAWESIMNIATKRGCTVSFLTDTISIGTTRILLYGISSDNEELQPVIFIMGREHAFIYSSPMAFENQSTRVSELFQKSDYAVIGTFGEEITDYSHLLGKYNFSAYSVLGTYFDKDENIIMPSSSVNEITFEGYPIRILLK